MGWMMSPSCCCEGPGVCCVDGAPIYLSVQVKNIADNGSFNPCCANADVTVTLGPVLLPIDGRCAVWSYGLHQICTFFGTPLYLDILVELIQDPVNTGKLKLQATVTIEQISLVVAWQAKYSVDNLDQPADCCAFDALVLGLEAVLSDVDNVCNEASSTVEITAVEPCHSLTAIAEVGEFTYVRVPALPKLLVAAGAGTIEQTGVPAGPVIRVQAGSGTFELTGGAVVTTVTECDPATTCCGRPNPSEGGGGALPSALHSDIVAHTCTCLDEVNNDSVVCLTGLDGRDFSWNGGDAWELQGNILCEEGDGSEGNPFVDVCELSSTKFRLECSRADASDCPGFRLNMDNTAGCFPNTPVYPKPGWSCNPLDMEFDVPVSGCSGNTVGTLPCVITFRIYEA